MSTLYYCKRDGNECELRESCERYLTDDSCHVTLFKEACTSENSHVLYIEKTKEVLVEC